MWKMKRLYRSKGTTAPDFVTAAPDFSQGHGGACFPQPGHGGFSTSRKRREKKEETCRSAAECGFLKGTGDLARRSGVYLINVFPATMWHSAKPQAG